MRVGAELCDEVAGGACADVKSFAQGFCGDWSLVLLPVEHVFGACPVQQVLPSGFAAGAGGPVVCLLRSTGSRRAAREGTNRSSSAIGWVGRSAVGVSVPRLAAVCMAWSRFGPSSAQPIRRRGVGGREILPCDGHVSARWWPVELPTGGL
jgi:hypothetical protein